MKIDGKGFKPWLLRYNAQATVCGKNGIIVGGGMLCWGIPYVAGVLALGWQIKPALTSTQMKALLVIWDKAPVCSAHSLCLYISLKKANFPKVWWINFRMKSSHSLSCMNCVFCNTGII